MNTPNEAEKREIKPHWKFGAAVLVVVILITLIIVLRGTSNPAPAAGGEAAATTDGALADPSAFVEDPAAAGGPCENPLTKCTNPSCKVTAAEVGNCDWSVAGGTTETPEKAVQTFARDLKALQDTASEDTNDQGYFVDQFMKTYRSALTPDDRKILQDLHGKTQDPFEKKALDLLLNPES